MAFPLSTYRLQMRADGFTFADALDVLDYLDDLGVSHLYLSPIPAQSLRRWVAQRVWRGCPLRHRAAAWG